MFKKILILSFLVAFNITFAEENFKINFAKNSLKTIKAGEEFKVNWWIKDTPDSGLVQLFLTGKTDRGVEITSDGQYTGHDVLSDRIGDTTSGTEKFSTRDIPAGSYQITAYLCDYIEYTCRGDQYLASTHKSNTLDITIKNNKSSYLDFDNTLLKGESFGFNEPITFKWFNENYSTGFLKFKLEDSDYIIYDIVKDSTNSSDARNDISERKEVRYTSFINRSFTWTGAQKGLKELFNVKDRESAYWDEKLKLEEGSYRFLMYVQHDRYGRYTTNNYIIKSEPFTLLEKDAQKTEVILPPKIHRAEPKKVTTTKSLTNRPSRRLNRRQLLEMYKRQSSQSKNTTTKNSKLSLRERIQKNKNQSGGILSKKTNTSQKILQRFGQRSYSSLKNRRR